MFDADALRDALTAPTVKWAGKEHKGRILSAHEFAPLHDRLTNLPETAPYETVVLILEDAYRACGLPPEIVREFPVGVLNAAVGDFFVSQARVGLPEA
jgi:hypothetical protein